MLAKYEIIKQDIIQMIEEKKFKPGDKIYSEGELKKIYNVSSTTVVRALQDLVLSGYLIRKQGEGTYVRKSFKHRRAFFDEGSPIIEEFKNEYNEKKIVESKKILIVEEIEDAEIAEKLKVRTNETLVKFCRVSYVNNTPWQVQNSYIPKKYLKKFDYNNLNENDRVSDEIKKALDINLMTLPMKQKIQVEFPISLKSVCDVLKINENTPLYKLERITYYPAQIPFEFIRSYIHYKFYSIEIQTEDNV
ncbi:GntR family transcriptional regulator [Clostridium butyricum]|uniref:GntR family transcriptional regulator n=1 Tax=Clostridium butyricum TaxID=1492 RepID=UPI0003D5D524|nr:GntR family transcriptional regulator [Clostridium butyricum]ETI91898.1 MAG: Transcriptional regulator, GntR family [Clostridium butyricum DORA_1]MBS5984055.1 GntR family transcriptional regulator [Clostridium butyricum]MBZ0314414.1 GntR family transcriptional regulator [Clostridium butyricum]MDU1508456.1 GntR family transcriptional regulator [Clostridium butyricum]MDU4800311.1 GntR family transcriptional regulator [Clostridium butyricum]